MPQKQGPPSSDRCYAPHSFRDLLVNLRVLCEDRQSFQRRSLVLLTLRLSNKSRFVRLHLTLLPQAAGRRLGRRLASPLHRTLTPGRISVGRPPFGRTGVSLSLTESSQYSLPSAVFRTDGNRSAPSLWPFDRSTQGRSFLLSESPASTDGLGASSTVACLFRQEAPSGTYPSLRIFDFQCT